MAATGATGTAYLSQPMLVFGNSIGSGNYTRPQGEVVEIESSPVAVISNGSPVAGDDKILNLEALTSGKIPKGAKAVYLMVEVRNSSITVDQGVQYGPINGSHYHVTVNPLVNNLTQSHAGRTACDSNGDIYQLVSEAGSTLSAHYVFVTAVELR